MAQVTADDDFFSRVVGAASQGAAGAVVGAGLSSVTEPVVNRVLVKRQTLSEALAEVDVETMSNFFNTAIVGESLPLFNTALTLRAVHTAAVTESPSDGITHHHHPPTN